MTTLSPEPASSTATAGTTTARRSSSTTAGVDDLADGVRRRDRRSAAACIVPGFVDLQVNGGGGALLNDTPTVDAIRTICSAHARSAPPRCLPTLITDTPEITADAVAAGIAAAAANVPGFLGLHLEGPHLSRRPQGRPRSSADPPDGRSRPRGAGRGAAQALPAPALDRRRRDRHPRTDRAPSSTPASSSASATPTRSYAAGRRGRRGRRDDGHPSLQRPDASSAIASPASSAPPSPIGSLHAGLIADGIHVHPAAIGVALRAKHGPGRIFLVTDAMSLTGTDRTEFTLNGRTILRRDGALRLADGTLAGADLTMIDAIAFMHRTHRPAARRSPPHGVALPRRGHRRRGRPRAPPARRPRRLRPPGDDLAVRSTWIGGERVFAVR